MIHRAILCLLTVHALLAVPISAQTSAPHIEQQKRLTAFGISQELKAVTVILSNPFEVLGMARLSISPVEIRCSPDGKWLATVGENKAILLESNDLSRQKEISGIDALATMAFSPQSDKLAILCRSGKILVVDTKSATLLAQTTQPSFAFQITFSHDGQRLYLSGDMGLRILDVRTLDVLTTAKTRRGTRKVLEAPDGKRLYVQNTLLRTLFVVDPSDGRITSEFEFEGELNDIALSDDGSTLYAAAGANTQARIEGGIAIISCTDLKLLTTVPMGPDLSNITIDDTGRVFAISRGLGQLTSLDPKTRQVKQIAARNALRVLAWRGTDSVLALTSVNGEVRVFDPGLENEIATFIQPRDVVQWALANIDPGAMQRNLLERIATNSQAARNPSTRGAPTTNLSLRFPTTIPSNMQDYGPELRGPSSPALSADLPIVRTLTAEQARRLQATPVTLSRNQLTLRSAIQAMERQLEFRLLSSSTNWMSNLPSAPVEIESTLPFWSVFEALGDAGNFDALSIRPGYLHMGDNRRALIEGNVPLTTIVSGPFRLRATPITTDPPNARGPRPQFQPLQLHIWNHPEPKIWIFGNSRAETIIEAVDENGRAIEIPPPVVFSHKHGPGFWIRLERPANSGKKLARLRGVGHLYTVVDSERMELDAGSFSQGKAVPVRWGSFTAIANPPIARAAPREFGHVHVNVLEWDRGTTDAQDWERLERIVRASRFSLLDGSDRPIVFDEPFVRSDSSKIQVELTTHGSTVAQKLVAERPLSITEIDVPFIFENLPLP